VPSRQDLDRTEAFLHGLNEHSRTGSPGNPLPTHARNAMISRSQQSLAKVAVTVSPESHLISKPSEHHRVSLA
jgi:hypothetical protein